MVCVCCTALCAVHRTDLAGSKSSDPVLFLLHRPPVTSYIASIAWFSALSISKARRKTLHFVMSLWPRNSEPKLMHADTNLWIHPLLQVGEIVLSQIPSITWNISSQEVTSLSYPVRACLCHHGIRSMNLVLNDVVSLPSFRCSTTHLPPAPSDAFVFSKNVLVTTRK